MALWDWDRETRVSRCGITRGQGPPRHSNEFSNEFVRRYVLANAQHQFSEQAAEAIPNQMGGSLESSFRHHAISELRVYLR
jgi:hypothetical protein